MKKIIYYEAEDGERFETEEECCAYENRFAELDKRVIFFDSNYERMEGDFLYKVEECEAIFISNDEDAAVIDRIFREVGYESPFHSSYKREMKAGHYYYSNDWRCLEEEKAKINELEFSFTKGRGLI